MSKILASVAPPILAAILAIGSFLICARILHLPPIASKVAITVIVATTSLAVLVVGASSLFRSKS